MNVYLRHEDQSTGQLFTECEFNEIHAVMSELKLGGGVYFDGSLWEDMSYQFVLGEGGAYVEIIIGSGE